MSALPMPSQHEEDRISLQFFQFRRGGFLVDVGAADGVIGSNSEVLITCLGWSGILIEPNPFYYPDLMARYAARRDVRVVPVAVDVESTQKVLHACGPFSTLDDGQLAVARSCFHVKDVQDVTVPCEPLTKILDDTGTPTSFDYLSIDAEAYDLRVIESLDWNRYRPLLVCVERQGVDDPVIDAMDRLGYEPYMSTFTNGFYIPRSP